MEGAGSAAKGRKRGAETGKETGTAPNPRATREPPGTACQEVKKNAEKEEDTGGALRTEGREEEIVEEREVNEGARNRG